MKFEIPDHCLNKLQKQSLDELLRVARGMHYANIVVRINGENRVFEADWIKSIVLEKGNER